jgi:hypothetical protein
MPATPMVIHERSSHATGAFPSLGDQSGLIQNQVLHFHDDANKTDSVIDMFSTLCTVHADISGMSKTLMPQRGLTGSLYYNLKFGIILCFGLTELKAQIVWTENVRERFFRGVSILTDHSDQRVKK